MKNTLTIVAVLAVMLIAAKSAIACHPAWPEICQAYSRSDAVFIGKLESVSEAKDGIDARFTVRKVYKGDVGKEIIVRFGQGDCDPRIDAIGQEYFVYKVTREPSWAVFNRTTKLIDAKEHVAYAESLSEQKPRFDITGAVSARDVNLMKAVKVQIEHDGKVHSVKLDSKGRFSFQAFERGFYTVRINLPASATSTIKELKTYYPVEGSVIEFSAEYVANGCDFREIHLGYFE